MNGKPCEHCGAPVPRWKRRDARHCDRTCRNAAYRRRVQWERLERRRDRDILPKTVRAKRGSRPLAEPQAVRDAAGVILEMLTHRPRTKVSLAVQAGASDMTIQRALNWLRASGVPIKFERPRMEWHLQESVPYEGVGLGVLVGAGVLTRAEALILACAAEANKETT